MQSPLDSQVGGNHYRDDFVIQPIEFITKNKLGFIQGCIIKYICRYDKKGTPLKDLEKCKHYIDLWVELEEIDGIRLKNLDRVKRYIDLLIRLEKWQK